MNATSQASDESAQTVGSAIRARWLNPRRKRFWAVIVVLFYTLFGFFAAPLIIKNSIVDFVSEDLGRSAVIEKVEVNPYVLSLRMQGFAVDDTDKVKLAGFDEFFVNFQLSSLFNWAWTFRDIHLAGPYFFFERYDAQDSRFSRLLADFPKEQPIEQPDEADAEEEGGVPRLIIHNLEVIAGHLDAKDNVPATVVETAFTPIDISIQDLNTLPDRHGKKSVTIGLQDNALLKWDGSLTLAPLDSEGEFVLENLQLDQSIAYLEALLPLESITASLSGGFHYSILMGQDGGLDARIDALQVELDDLGVNGLTPTTEFLSIPKIAINGGTLRYPEQSLQLNSLRIEEPRMTAWLNENGAPSLAELVPASEDGTEATEPAGESPPWQLGLDELIIEQGSLALSDKSIEPAAMVDVSNLQVKLTDINNQDGALFPLTLSGTLPEGGSFDMDASLGVFPEVSFTGDSRTRGIALSLGQPYVQQQARVVVEAGELDSEIKLTMPAGQAVTAGGAIRVSGLEVNDGIEGQRLLGWDELEIDNFDFDAGAGKLHLSQMLFKQLFGRIVINEDQSTNLSALVIEQAESTADTSAEPMNFVIGGIGVDDGSMDFADLSLPLPFATRIAGLGGTISTIATDSSEPANIALEGQVDEYGLARIEGSMNLTDPVRHTDITVEFRNLLMSSLSPYTVEFAGRAIDEGKLDLGLTYAISDGMLHGENDVVLSDLVLGEKVEHPDAASLPLGLAVALLTDANGVIEIDLPVDGDINDPEFKIGGVIWQAFAGLITKIVSAPFKLLGSLIGIDSEDLGQFEFLAGRYDLTPPELEKVTQLETALQQRPELAVEISGVTDPAIDTPALKAIRLRKLVAERLGEEIGEKDKDAMMLDVEIRAVLENLFGERFPDIPPKSLAAKHTAPPADDPKGKPVFDELAYAVELWERLLDSEVISEKDLGDLAQARARAISDAFLADGKFDQNRVVIVQPKEVESEDGEWVTLELAVATD